VEGLDKKMIRQVFRNVQKHRAIAQLIRQFSTNKEDIRKRALHHVDLSNSRHILELGCAFGAFTEALKGRLHPDASITGIDMIPEYGPFFIEACKRAGYEGFFISSGINRIMKFPSSSFDLVICSYALYFFPEIIPEIARILQRDGIFITITHSNKDMREVVAIVKKILHQNHLLNEDEPLPIEIIFDQFSAENGTDLLKPFFGKIKTVDFQNNLVFHPHEIEHFINYFQFKKSFFLTEKEVHNKTVIQQFFHELKDTAMKNNFVSICKDDRIFICSSPLTVED
jgi:ubiquinone/menaquinone biosynthesis C-methylase UbiE